MNLYVDASVLLRIVLHQTPAIGDPSEIGTVVTSSLALLECLRTVDRVRLAEGLDDDEVSRRRTEVFRLYDGCSVVELDEAVLDRASQPLPTTLSALDAIHLASAMMWSADTGDPLVLATHDRRLARAATSMGVDVIGV